MNFDISRSGFLVSNNAFKYIFIEVVNIAVWSSNIVTLTRSNFRRYILILFAIENTNL